jgi:hypothetical protein
MSLRLFFSQTGISSARKTAIFFFFNVTVKDVENSGRLIKLLNFIYNSQNKNQKKEREKLLMELFDNFSFFLWRHRHYSGFTVIHSVLYLLVFRFFLNMHNRLRFLNSLG